MFIIHFGILEFRRRVKIIHFHFTNPSIQELITVDYNIVLRILLDILFSFE